jgi:hypothetical protein
MMTNDIRELLIDWSNLPHWFWKLGDGYVYFQFYHPQQLIIKEGKKNLK